MQAAPEYDTFGSTAAEVARRAAQADAAGRSGTLPNLMPDDLLVPVADSMGARQTRTFLTQHLKTQHEVQPCLRCLLLVLSLFAY